MNILQRLARNWQTARLAGRARSALRDGRPTEAITHASALQRLQPDDPQTNFLLAQIYVDAGRHTEALSPLGRVSECWPDDAPTWYALGVCHDYLDHPAEAVTAYRRTLVLAPHWMVALKHLGRCAWRLGDRALASRALARYCADVPDDKEAHDLLGYLAYEQGHLRDASSHYAEAARLDPQNPILDRNARLLYRRSATS